MKGQIRKQIQRYLAMIMIIISMFQILQVDQITVKANDDTYHVNLVVMDNEERISTYHSTITVKMGTDKNVNLNLQGDSYQGDYNKPSDVSENTLSGNHLVNIKVKGYEQILGRNVMFTLSGNSITGKVNIHDAKLYNITGRITKNTKNGKKPAQGVTVNVDNKVINDYYAIGNYKPITDEKGDYSVFATVGPHQINIKDENYRKINPDFTVSGANIQNLNHTIDPKLRLKISVGNNVEDSKRGTVSIKAKDNEKEKVYTSCNNTEYNFYYGDQIEITAKADATSEISMNDITNFTWIEEGKIAKWKLKPIKDDYYKWINFTQLQELTVTYDDSGISSKYGKATDYGSVQTINPDIFMVNTINKNYPVISKNAVKVNEITTLSGNTFGYQFKEKGSVEVKFAEDTNNPTLSVSGNCTIPSLSNNGDEEDLYTNHDMSVYVDVMDQESGIFDVTRKNVNSTIHLKKGPYFIVIDKDFMNINEGTPVTFEAYDKVGNHDDKTIRVYYKTAPPKVISVSLNSSNQTFRQNENVYVKGDVTLDAVIDDDFGKIKSIKYCVFSNDKKVPKYTDFKNVDYWIKDGNTYTFHIDKKSLNDGFNCVYIIAEDYCGNIGLEYYNKKSFYTDNIEPEIKEWKDSIRTDFWKKPTDEIKMSGTIYDDKTPAGLSYAYKVTEDNNKPDCPDNWTFVGNKAKNNIPFEQIIPPEMRDEMKKDRSYTLWVWAKDGCGNISNPKGYIIHIDGTQPKISDFKFDMKENGSTAVRKFIRSFGNFFNLKLVDGIQETVKVSVKASDLAPAGAVYYDGSHKEIPEQEVKPGLTDVVLYYATQEDPEMDEYLKTMSMNSCLPERVGQTPQGDGTYEFELKVPYNTKFYKIYVFARDKAGNISYTVPSKNKDYNSDLVMVDQVAPAIDFELAAAYQNPVYVKDNKQWYKNDKDQKIKKEITYKINVSDMDSGLFKTEFRINNKSLTSLNCNYLETNPDKMINNADYSVGTYTDEAQIADDGSYRFDVKVTDNAGNETNGSKTIYVDMDQPVITGILFQCKDKKDQADELSVKKDGYGYFFLKDTTVKVTATDFIYNGGKEVKKDSNKNEIEGSGVRNITYVMYDVDKKKNKTEKMDAIPVKNSHGVYMTTFTIPAGFRGQISAFATDQVGQESIEARPKGSVLETQKEHDTKYATTTISIPETKYKDAEGNPLYNYKPVVSLFTEDRKSGIQNIKWLIKAEHIPQFESGKKVDVLSDYSKDTGKWQTSITGDIDGWKSSIDQPNKKTKANDLNLVRFLSKKHQIQVEENHFTATLRMTDNVGNQDAKVTKKVFSVDTTAPKITVEYDNNDVYNEKYYNKERKATVTVEDANFSEKDCVFTITGDGVEIGKWTHIPGPFCDGKVHSKKCKWQCVVSFVQDGDYTFAFKCKDLAGWESSYEKVDEFTIDKTLPKIHVDYDNNDVANGIYYKEARTATVHIDEHNFRADDVKITMTAADGSKQIAVPSVSGWSSNDDDRTATIHYDYDGSFTFDVEYTDLANNEAEDYQQDAFTVDLTEPEIEIIGVNDKAAYSGKVVPVISCTDTNTDASKTSVALTGYKRGKVTVKPASSIIPGGVKLTMEDIPHKKDMDDIYTLEVKMEDKAGNTSEKKILYSVNRFGSNYILSDETMKMIQKGFINEPQDVVLSEVNVNKLSSSTITCTLDGEVVTLKPNEDYSVKESGGGDSWTTYEYRINADNFEEEGRYVVSVMSKDNAGNVTDNKVKDQNIEFTVDRTPPSTVISGVTDKGQYTDSTRTITLNVADNVGVDKVIVYCNDKQIASFDRWQIDEKNGDLSVTLNSSKDWQTIKIVTLDVAGNEMSSKEMKVLLTKNLVVQWYKNRVLFFATIITLVLLIAAITLLLTKKKNKKQIVQE